MAGRLAAPAVKEEAQVTGDDGSAQPEAAFSNEHNTGTDFKEASSNGDHAQQPDSAEQSDSTVVAEETSTVSPRNKLNDLEAREWVAETKSLWFQKGLGATHPDAAIERQHPAPFSYQDVTRLIRFFTKKGQ